MALEIIERVKSLLPAEAISRVELEGSEIIAYTKDRDFFVKHETSVREIVGQIKKRIEVRPEAAICMDQQATKKKIMEMVPPEANVKDIYFEEERSLVIIAAEKPGLVIGRGGDTFRAIRAETFWVPRIERIPPIKSDVINGIRKVIHDEVKFRKQFLNKIGEKIFTERKTNRDWIRIIPLGGFREVGRSCILLETPKSKVLIDCGISPGGLAGGNGFPYFTTKEFDPQDIDAIILSHAHLDHCLHPDSLIQLSDGTIQKISEVRSNENVKSVDFQNDLKLDEMNAFQRGGVKSPRELLEVRTRTKRIKVTEEHPFFCIENGIIKTKLARDLKKRDFIASLKEIKIRGSKQSLPNTKGFPSELDSTTAQIIGYILGDGTKSGGDYNSVICTDKNMKNLRNYKKLVRIKFGLKSKVKQRERNRLEINSADFRRWLESIEPTMISKSIRRKIPPQVCRSQLCTIAGFLRGLFDAEGSIKDHSVVLSSSSENITYVSQLLLLRFGIISHIYDHDESESTFGGGDAFQLVISNPASLQKFLKKINFDDPNKKLKLKKMIKKTGRGIGEKINLIPIKSEFMIKIAEKIGLRKIDLRKLGFSYSHYQRDHFPSMRKMTEILDKLSRIAKRKGKKIKELEYLKRLIKSEIMWEPVTGINKVKSDVDEVYDLTIPGHSNYIANGIVVHNCGMIPYLYEYGFDGPLYCTTPTLDLFALLTLDTVDIIQKNAGSPLYSAKGVKEAVRHSITLDYGEVSDVAPDIRLTFQNAGHILGSALVHLHIGEGLHNIVYALDQKYAHTNLLEPAFTDFQRCETLIIESTYGAQGDIMPTRAETEERFMNIINTTMERGGTVLIPSFAVERAQELMAILVKNGFNKPVYLDGMIWDTNGIYTAYPEYLSHQTQKLIFNNQDPFKNEMFKRIASQADREKAWTDKPSVIISTSGMLIGGPAIEHLKQLAEDPKNTLIFVSFQAEGTMGRRIQRGWREIPVKVSETKTATIPLKLQMETIEGLSGHSDRNQLLSFIHNLSAQPDKIIAVHGESAKSGEFARSAHKIFRIETVAPKNLEGIRLR